MEKRILVDGLGTQETRVAVIVDGVVEDFYIETQNDSSLKGNIYLAKVARIEPALQAAFVDYGGDQHGFLPFGEIHPNYFRIPVEDRQALYDEENALEEDDEEAEGDAAEGNNEDAVASGDSEDLEDDNEDAVASGDSEDLEDDNEDAVASGDSEDLEDDNEDVVASGDSEDLEDDNEDAVASGDSEDLEDDNEDAVASGDSEDLEDDNEDAVASGDSEEFEDDNEDAEASGNNDSPDGVEKGSKGRRDRYQRNSRRNNNNKGRWSYRRNRETSSRRLYRIQEVIKKNQIILVQVTKERRGNKGVSLSSYITLASRYCVFMANSTRGGGVSRKIGTQKMRADLRGLLEEMEIPKGQAVILRTAGAGRTKEELRKDYQDILEVWNNIRNKTMEATAPSMIHEEASLAKRLVRDFYDEDVKEIQISGDKFYKEVRDNMAKILPTHKRRVKQFKENEPIFQTFGVEEALESAFSPRVALPSGGYIVIVQTEALVSIDVNSGRSTRERSIGDTAVRTNLEAASEIARQLRLRDMAGLVVIDFIDMNNAYDKQLIEDRLRQAISLDRARTQIGSISMFGLLEMSRQRLRSSLTELGTEKCTQCQGTGYVMSQPMISRKVLRSLEGYLSSVGSEKLESFETPQEVLLKVPMGLGVRILNDYRREVTAIEDRYKVVIKVEEISVEKRQANSVGDLFVLEPSENLPTIQETVALGSRTTSKNNRRNNKSPRDDKDTASRRGTRGDERGQDHKRGKRSRSKQVPEGNTEQPVIETENEQSLSVHEAKVATGQEGAVVQDLSTQPQPDAGEALEKLAASRKGRARTKGTARRPVSFRGKGKPEQTESENEDTRDSVEIVLDLSDLEQKYVVVEDASETLTASLSTQEDEQGNQG